MAADVWLEETTFSLQIVLKYTIIMSFTIQSKKLLTMTNLFYRSRKRFWCGQWNCNWQIINVHVKPEYNASKSKCRRSPLLACIDEQLKSIILPFRRLFLSPSIHIAYFLVNTHHRDQTDDRTATISRCNVNSDLCILNLTTVTLCITPCPSLK